MVPMKALVFQETHKPLALEERPDLEPGHGSKVIHDGGLHGEALASRQASRRWHDAGRAVVGVPQRVDQGAGFTHVRPPAASRPRGPRTGPG